MYNHITTVSPGDVKIGFDWILRIFQELDHVRLKDKDEDNISSLRWKSCFLMNHKEDQEEDQEEEEEGEEDEDEECKTTNLGLNITSVSLLSWRLSPGL